MLVDFDVGGWEEMFFCLFFSVEEEKLWIMETRILTGCDSLELKCLNDRFVLYKHAAFHFTRC